MRKICLTAFIGLTNAQNNGQVQRAQRGKEKLLRSFLIFTKCLFTGDCLIFEGFLPYNLKTSDHIELSIMNTFDSV